MKNSYILGLLLNLHFCIYLFIAILGPPGPEAQARLWRNSIRAEPENICFSNSDISSATYHFQTETDQFTISLSNKTTDFSNFSDVLDLLIAVCVRLRFVAVAVLDVYLLPFSGPSIFRKRGRWAQMSEMLLLENDMLQFGKDWKGSVSIWKLFVSVRN